MEKIVSLQAEEEKRIIEFANSKNLLIDSKAVSVLLKKANFMDILEDFAQRNIFLVTEAVLGDYLAKKEIPDLQLVLEGAIAADDPESAGVYARLKTQYRSDPDLHLHDSQNDSPVWVNALQRSADVVIQKSLREGFGLTVTEALWKGKAVIGGDTPGIRLQIKNGRTGFVVGSPEECARRIVQLIRQPALARRLGRQGQALVRREFLMNRLILDFLRLSRSLA